MELLFHVTAEWSGVGRQGEGTMHFGNTQVSYSAPASMGGKGTGTSPEELLIAAVTACYSGTLMRVLKQARLPGVSVAIRTEGIVEEYPENPRFARILVHPTIQGGDVGRQGDYNEAAHAARERCFIGRTVRDYLDYVVADVTIV